MGIQGLLPLLKSTMAPIHIKDLEGCCVAVDTYSWLHKGALSCSTQLCKGLPTSRHIEYCMHRVNLLRHYGVTPILVFDGGLLPMKMEQENKRARTRKENLARAIEHESNGNSAAAYDCYQKAVDISPSIAHELIQVLKQENVAYVVAPYEADAQMTFLAMNKQVDVVITEDSDLIPFGCPRIMFKMDKYGQGVEFQCSRLQRNRELSFSGFNHKMLLEMCILSGCDYLPSLPGMGLKRAHALIMKFKSYDKVIKHLKYSTVSVPPLYDESFKKAILTFQHQRVYDPISEDIMHLSDIHDNVSDDLDFLGPSMPQHIAKAIATGDIDPFTKMPFQGESTSSGVVMERTSKYEKVKPETGRRKLDLPVQKNLLTKYFCFASLEAKRKFRAPRSSPTNPSSTEGTEEITACNINCNMSSSLDSVENSPQSSFPKNNPAERDSGSILDSLESVRHNEKEGQDHASIKQIAHTIHNPCQALLMECDFKNVASAVQNKTRVKNVKVLVRSSYFQHNSLNKSDQDNEQEKLLAKNDISIKLNSAKMNGEDNKQQRPLLKNDASIDTCEDTMFQSFRNPRTENRNVITRSPYFLQQSENKYDHNGQERLLVKDVGVRDTCEAISQESGSSKNNPFDSFSMKSENNPFDSFSMKRKTSLDSKFEKENMKTKYMRTSAAIANAGCCDSDPDEAVMLTKTEEVKFGSDVSHLSRYSNIAEESMGRFVSMLESFRYSSSGSRASGLRAPLKDMQNTRTNKSSTAAVDFSRFAYAPHGKKTALASRRH